MNLVATNKKVLNNQSGFTLIELIMVIVILGILAVVAIPKYADLQEEAADAAAEGVYGAAQGAAAINFATNLVNTSKASVAPDVSGVAIDTGADILASLDGTPDGWVAGTCGTNACIQTPAGTATHYIYIATTELHTSTITRKATLRYVDVP